MKTHEVKTGAGDKLLDCNEVAELIGCHPRHVHRMADAGQIPAGLKIGKLRRWNARILADWIHNGCPTVSAGGDQP